MKNTTYVMIAVACAALLMSFLAPPVVVQAVVSAGSDVGVPAPHFPLSADQREFLRHVSMVDLPDGLGGFVRTARISGINVQIVNGSGTTTGVVDGLGNLIVGYNELRTSGDDRTGSHNLIVGMEHNYSSFGGLVAGLRNTVSGAHCSVSGGLYNTASGYYSSVSGGQSNLAYGGYIGYYGIYAGGSISGGFGNTASGRWSSVSGGRQNAANGDFSSVSGGRYNTASGRGSSVSGGRQNAATKNFSSVSGGRYNTASGNWSSVSGGWYNTASRNYSSVSGGRQNTASGYYSSVSGGNNGTASGDDDWVAGSLFEDN